MMRFKFAGVEFSAHFLVVALMSFAVITDTSEMVCICILSAVLHECGHLCAMFFFGIKPKRITLRAFDIAIDAKTDKSILADIIITLCGPLSNLLFALVFVCFSKRLFYSNIVIGLFNLIPVKTFDGGHALHLFLMQFLSEKYADIVIGFITFVLLIPLFIIGILVLFESRYNYSLLFISLYLAAILFMK